MSRLQPSPVVWVATASLCVGLLRKAGASQDSWPLLPQGLTFTGYGFLLSWPAGHAQPQNELLAHTIFLACCSQNLAGFSSNM